MNISIPMHDTLPKTTSPKSHFAEKPPCRKDTSPKSLPNFGENAEKVKKKKKKKMRIQLTSQSYVTINLIRANNLDKTTKMSSGRKFVCLFVKIYKQSPYLKCLHQSNHKNVNTAIR